MTMVLISHNITPNATIECAGLGEDVRMAAPKSASIMTTLNALNPSGEDVWVGLDDRCEVLARQK